MENNIVDYTDEVKIVYEETLDHCNINSHYHNTYEIIYIIEGKVRVSVNSRNYEAGTGALIFISHLEAHGLEIVGLPYKRYYLLIKPQLFKKAVPNILLSSIFTQRPKEFRHILQLSDQEIDHISAIFNEIKQELNIKHGLYPLEVPALLHLLLIHLYRRHQGNFPLTNLTGCTNTIIQIQQYIDDHYLEEITLGKISKMFYIDMYYLSRMYKVICGFSFKEYIILQRLSRAKDLLVGSDMRITAVCSSSGCENVNHFIRIFKQHEGITPYQYRKKWGLYT